MAEANENGVNINQDNNEVEEQVGAEAQAGAEVQGRLEVQAGDLERGETFEVTQSAIALWDYAQEIAQDNTEFAQAHPQAPHPVYPPIQMSRRDKCLLGLMVEDRREAVIRLWEELNEIERLLGLEHI
ncbi:hypothetical protein CY34DRAFT_17915 [Suillus luteus UH-Slu-Lm8-n1]|uniref:Uncharacterized protein n=1 Tax=Suillus luteus UH-Slu-Lm8-n1 TaxID=930992 RepID=A0A0C9ZXI5_9AGAM|nr:hypothetical protein CY34DRAFT_17915 [Suillus luteus UH-Slu-Lm8-n1]